MFRFKTIVFMLFLCVFMTALPGIGGPRVVADNDTRPLYLKNNIHVYVDGNGDSKASYANWTDPGAGHQVVPVNTQVEIEMARLGFYIIVKSSGKRIDFEFNAERMAMSAEDYVKLITTREPVSLKELSEIDRKGIAEGKAHVGMSKDGVRIALGYPAVHKTPSLNESTWIYWRNRWGTTAIDFDNKGKVKFIR